MNKGSKNTVDTLLNYLKEQLNCNQKIIAKFTGLNESTLSANSEKTIEEVATKKAGKRLLALYMVVHHFVDKGISPVVIKESINEFVFEDLEGNSDSVVSAILSDKYPLAVLVNIAELGFQQYKNKLSARDELYPAVMGAISAVG